MSDFKKWEDLEKELDFAPEEDLKLQIEISIVKGIIEVKK